MQNNQRTKKQLNVCKWKELLCVYECAFCYWVLADCGYVLCEV